jgi:polar amino acid transport system substrate-binding protein
VFSSSRTRRLLGVGLLVVAITGCGSTTSTSSQPTQQSTLDRVIASGTLKVAIILTLPPFGTKDANGNPQGFDVDVANALGKSLGVNVEITDVSGADRIPFLVTSKVDVIVGALTITPERAKTVAFTDHYVAAGAAILLAMKDAPYTNIQDIITAGKSVALAKGTTQDLALSAEYPSLQIQRFDTTAAALLAVKQGQAAALVEDSNIVAYMAAQDPSMKIVNNPTTGVEYYGIACRHGDSDWYTYLNTWVGNFNDSGQNAATYKKWFGVAPLLPLHPNV